MFSLLLSTDEVPRNQFNKNDKEGVRLVFAGAELGFQRFVTQYDRALLTFLSTARSPQAGAVFYLDKTSDKIEMAKVYEANSQSYSLAVAEAGSTRNPSINPES